MKHYFADLATILFFAFIFFITSVATGQPEEYFNEPEPRLTSKGEYRYTKRNAVFWIPESAVFQIKGRIYVYADRLTNEKNQGDHGAFIVSDNRFETFKMYTEVNNARFALKEDIEELRDNPSNLYIFIEKEEESGYTILFRSKSYEQIEKDRIRVSRLSDLRPKTIQVSKI